MVEEGLWLDIVGPAEKAVVARCCWIYSLIMRTGDVLTTYVHYIWGGSEQFFEQEQL